MFHEPLAAVGCPRMPPHASRSSDVRYSLERRLRKPALCIVSLVCSIFANHHPHLSGTVVNQARLPARGVTATLVGMGVCDTVDSLGRFVLQPPAGGAAHTRVSALAPWLADGDRRDVLVFSRHGRPRAAFGVRTDHGTLRVALDLEPVEIVSVAEAELGHGPHQVGRGLESYPFDLGRFLGPGEAWCSEFVSWVYLVAGYPLGDTAAGEWIIRSSRGLRRWFRKYARFVERDDPYWDHADPSPGDYIRYDNALGGHSGIVRGVSGTTLYTIEGNVSNRVVARTIRHWRRRNDIDGFGLRSGVNPGMYVRDVSNGDAHRSRLLGRIPRRILESLGLTVASADAPAGR